MDHQDGAVMNVLSFLLDARPDIIDHLPPEPAPSLSTVLDVAADLGEHEWQEIGEAYGDGPLPSITDVQAALRRLPLELGPAIERAHLVRLPRPVWREWTERATGWAAPRQWVQFTGGGEKSADLGVLAPQERDPELRISAFQGSTDGVPSLLLPLHVGLSGGPPAVTSVTLDAPSGCDMNRDGECELSADACAGPCGLQLVISQAGRALVCECLR
jgi:hypothetical protein